MDNILLGLDDNLSSLLDSETQGFNLNSAINELLPNISSENSLLGTEQFLNQVFASELLQLEEVISGISDTSANFITGFNTVSTFDLEADLTNQDSFYNIPYPNDLRLNADGSPDLTGLPIPDNNIFAKSLKSIAGDREGFPVNSAGYFEFNLPVAQQDVNEVIAADTDSPILLIDIDPDSPNRGELLPTVASTFRQDLNYIPSSLLSVAPAPGIILHPNRTYAYVVKRSLDDAFGRPLDVSPTLDKLIDGEIPAGELGDEAQQLYQPLWETLSEIEVDSDEVAAATVFTTGDVVSDFAKLSDEVLERYDVTIENLELAPDGASNPRFYELQGTVTMPQFQKGTAPYNTEGLFEFAEDGSLIEQRTEEVPVVITIPKTPIPSEGYPLVAYYHGSNGLSTQVVDRGPIPEPGGEPIPGLGPAYVVAEEGFAAVSSALPLNPERFDDNRDDSYLNPLNVAAYRDTFRQSVIEQRLLLEAIEDLEISSEVIGADVDEDILLPPGENITFQSSSVVALGQSYGAQVANIMAAIEPKIGAVVPTGSPSYFPLLISEQEFAPLVGLLFGTLQPINFLYPALNLLTGTATEVVDPIVYMPHIAQRPLPGNPVRSIYQPVGKGDTQVSEAVFNANALASGVEQAGTILWPEMQESLALQGLDGIVPYPVANNVLSSDGTPYTGVVVQYEGDGVADPHGIFAQLDEVKQQYSSFFDSFQETGVAVVPQT